MKKLFFLVIAIAIYSTSFSFSSISSLPKKAADVYLPIGTTGKQISLLNLSRIDVKQFENISGRHLKFFDRMGFKVAQKKLRNSINADGTIQNKKLNKFLEQGDHSTGFHIGGFALGFLVGLIGVLIAYLINDDYKRNRVKWAWIGFGVYVVLLVVLLAAFYSNSGIN
ncbi:MAG: hypothetical protein ABIN25_07460 [Ginsengibacter sp.]